MPQQITIPGIYAETRCDWCATTLWHGANAIRLDDGNTLCSDRCFQKMDAYNNAKKAVRERLDA